MSVIAQLRIPADSFELGRILELEHGSTVELENVIPLGEQAVPFFSVHDVTRKEFESRVRSHPSVDNLQEVSSGDDRTLYAMQWKLERDLFFEGLLETRAQLLSGSGGPTTWEFEIRFPDHDRLSAFREFCENARISPEVVRVYNPTSPDSGPWYGLTEAQRTTLLRAVEAGYYSIPREISTKELAAEFDISDQAVTERLRRAIVALVENTLVSMAESEDSERGEKFR